jgi:toxin ParE1/3/4
MLLIWNNKASQELEGIYNYKDSPQNAVLVLETIFNFAETLVLFPYKYPKEPIINLENVRFAVIWSFKIIYAIENENVVVLKIFNTHQNPSKLKK